jgi:hypothetical protein
MAYETVVWQLQCALQLYLDIVSSDQEIEDDGPGPLMKPAQFRLFDDHKVQSESYVNQASEITSQLMLMLTELEQNRTNGSVDCVVMCFLSCLRVLL